MDRKDTNTVRRNLAAGHALDNADRKLLGLVSKDASQSYAELGAAMNLSPPAVHERIKRLKQAGVIKATIAVIDGAAVGRPLLAFIHVHTSSWAGTRQLVALEQFPEVEEIHTVTGESAMLLKVRTRDTRALEELLGRIHAIEGFSGSRSYIALSTYLERGPSPLDDHTSTPDR